ncbi:MAG: hypothetical protein RRY79_07770 [Clostridia bacterium]
MRYLMPIFLLLTIFISGCSLGKKPVSSPIPSSSIASPGETKAIPTYQSVKQIGEDFFAYILRMPYSGSNNKICFIDSRKVLESLPKTPAPISDDPTIGLAKYDDAFFVHSRLIIIDMTQKSGSVNTEVLGIDVDGKTIAVRLKVTEDEYGTADMAQRRIFVEVPLEKAGGVTTAIINFE